MYILEYRLVTLVCDSVTNDVSQLTIALTVSCAVCGLVHTVVAGVSFCTYMLHHLCLLQETKTKIDRVQVLKEELKTHLAKLPDLSKLASTAVAPLPAAGDLFN